MNILEVPRHTFEEVSFPSYTLSFERLTDQFAGSFSPKELKEYLSLYEKAQGDPKGARAPAEELLKKHPHLPEVYNLLGYIYVRLKKMRKAEKLIEQNYSHNPKNLFARINYADQCLRRNKLEQIPVIFESAENLNELYPERRVFHYSEVLGFYVLMGFYYLKLKQPVKARDYSAFAKLIDPEDAALRHLVKKLSRKSLLGHIAQVFHKKA